MSALPFLPLLVYGLSLAIHGDPLLLIISSFTIAIWFLPGFLELKPKKSSEEIPLKHLKPEPGTLVTVHGNAFKLPPGTNQVIRVEVTDSDISDFYASLSICLDEEVWILGDRQIRSAECMRWFNYKDNPLGLDKFLEELVRRVEIDFPINLFVIGQSLRDIEQTLVASLSHSSNLRIFVSGAVSTHHRQLRAELRDGSFHVTGVIDDQPIEFLMANSAVTEGKESPTNMTDRLANLGHL